MSTKEFSDIFDVKLASYIYDNNKFGVINKISFDEYEKSVFLSQAQEEIILELYSGRNNKSIEFESTEESKRLLHNLIKEKTYSDSDEDIIKKAQNKYFVSKPTDLLFIIYEQCELQLSTALVIPTKYDDLFNDLNNPFKGPSLKRVLRVDSENGMTLYSKYTIDKYIINYIKKPAPIILLDLENDLEINGISTKSESEVDSSLHNDIVDRAVKLALQSKAYLLQK